MSEWIKFTLSTENDFRTWFDMKLDGVVHMHTGDDGVEVDQHTSRYVGGDKRERVMWFGMSEPAVSESAEHVIQITVKEWEGDQLPTIKLDSIRLGDLDHIPSDTILTNSVTTWNVVTPELQVLINSGLPPEEGGIEDGDFVTEDLGDGVKEYYTSTWDGRELFGNGCWRLAFTTPYMNWFDTLHEEDDGITE